MQIKIVIICSEEFRSVKKQTIFAYGIVYYLLNCFLFKYTFLNATKA